jgi:hypothetical protein
MRETCKSGSMRGCRKRATSRRACALLYRAPENSELLVSQSFHLVLSKKSNALKTMHSAHDTVEQWAFSTRFGSC